MSTLSPTAEDILACARKLVIAGGYNGFSYADIAKTVGIRKPSIHHHFPTKADLVCKLVARHREETEAGLTYLSHRTPDQLEQLRAYTAHWRDCILDSSPSFCVCALLASELPVLPAEVAQEVRTYFRALSAWLTSVLDLGQREGRLSLADTPRLEAEAFMATVHGAMLSARAYGDPEVFGAVTTPLINRLSA